MLNRPSSFPAVKPWKPRWTPSEECRTPGLPLGPDPGPAPALALAQDPLGAASGRRGAHEADSSTYRMWARGQLDKDTVRPWGAT